MAIEMDENELWLLSFYRTSEIGGALFFGRLARSMRQGANQRDMSKHFADEAQHAWLWTSCIERMGAHPLKLADAYQDQYLAAAGLPVNLMEVLAVTQVFESRVINQYARHQRAPGLHQVVGETLARIMEDEKWHVEWVRGALREMEPEYGKEKIEQAIRHFREADEQVYRKTLLEHEERVAHLIGVMARTRGEEPKDGR
jgi:hypothetical protein